MITTGGKEVFPCEILFADGLLSGAGNAALTSAGFTGCGLMGLLSTVRLMSGLPTMTSSPDRFDGGTQVERPSEALSASAESESSSSSS